MSSWFNWIAGKRVAPGRVSTDKVVPLFWMDDTKTNRSLILNFTMVFDDVLDAGKMVGALEKLLERPGWRKLGARLRLNANGKLEYHIPEKYTSERRAVAFTHARHDMSIDDHPLASQIPRPNGFAQVSGTHEQFKSLFVPDNVPTKLEDYLYSDRAMIGLHIVSFGDATLVTFTWIHTFIDAMSQATIFKAWTDVLNGREDQIPELIGEEKDPLVTLGARIDLDDERDEEWVLKKHIASNASMMRFVFNLGWELSFYRAEETRSIVIPARLFAMIKQQAFNELRDVDQSTLVMDTRDPKHPKPFLSDGDILCAWAHRLFTGCQPWVTSAPPSRIIHIINIFNMTELLKTTEPKLLPEKGVHIGNCVTTLSSLIRLDDFLSLPLGVVAGRIRSDLVAQTTRPQINANMRLFRTSLATTGNPPFCGEGDMILAGFSNWSKGNFFDTDFGAAVVEKGDKEKVRSANYVRGRPTAVFTSAATVLANVRNSGPLLGKDSDGNWWVSAVLRTETWGNVERKMAEVNREMGRWDVSFFED